MSIVNTLALESNRKIKINFDGGDLSSDAGLSIFSPYFNTVIFVTISFALSAST